MQNIRQGEDWDEENCVEIVLPDTVVLYSQAINTNKLLTKPTFIYYYGVTFVPYLSISYELLHSAFIKCVSKVQLNT